MLKKTKTQFFCNECGAVSPKWQGQCLECKTWNSLTEQTVNPNPKQSGRKSGFSGLTQAKTIAMQSVTLDEQPRHPTGQPELDRVLGGGLVPGSVVLIGGDPGIGKSTLLIQTLAGLSLSYNALYVTGEESLQQVALRARRLGLKEDNLQLLAETRVETILDIAKNEHPQVMVIDSIQTLFSEYLTQAPGSVSQIRESAAELVQFAKTTQTALFLVGHVTKEGSLAGPRVLEHMVDTVLYFEGERDSRFRVIRAVKNRFGAVNELGIFAMTDKGLKEVSNPSAIFLSRYDQKVSGSAVMVTWEGSRPMLVEVQALVDESHLGNPRRVIVGLEQNRLSMLLAVLNRHGRVATFDKDVFVNVVGGMKVSETAADLAVLLAIVSSLKNQPLPEKLIVFGEIGLSGELRPVQSGQERLREAKKHGFTKAVVPKANCPKAGTIDMEIIAAGTLAEALEHIY